MSEPNTHAVRKIGKILFFNAAVKTLVDLIPGENGFDPYQHLDPEIFTQEIINDARELIYKLEQIASLMLDKTRKLLD